jgi:hypothetical protein
LFYENYEALSSTKEIDTASKITYSFPLAATDLKFEICYLLELEFVSEIFDQQKSEKHHKQIRKNSNEEFQT